MSVIFGTQELEEALAKNKDKLVVLFCGLTWCRCAGCCRTRGALRCMRACCCVCRHVAGACRWRGAVRKASGSDGKARSAHAWRRSQGALTGAAAASACARALCRDALAQNRARRPCKGVSKPYEKIAGAYGKVVFLKLFGNANAACKALFKSFRIRSTPSFLFFRGGAARRARARIARQLRAPPAVCCDQCSPCAPPAMRCGAAAAALRAAVSLLRTQHMPFVGRPLTHCTPTQRNACTPQAT